MKKALSVFLAAVMLLAMLQATVLAAGEITVDVQAENELTALKAGDVVTVSVVLPAVTATNKLQLDLNFDNEFFTYNGDAKAEAVLSKLIIGKVEASGDSIIRLAAAGMMTTADFEAGTVAFKASFTVKEDAAGQSETFYLSGLNCGDATVTASAAKTTVGIYVAPHEHAWDDGVITTPATHTAEGVKTFSCECGETKTEPVAKLTDHAWDEGVVTTPATCKEEGVMTYTCECGETKTESIAKLAEHVWDEGVVTTEPTETTTGVKTYTCVCGETKTEEIPMIPVVTTPIVMITEEVTGENELTLTFTLKNNAGFKGYGLYVEYDETAMTLKALNAGALSNGLFTANVDEAYANFANAKEVTGDGVLFTAVFDTTNAKAGEYEFTLSGTMTNASYAKEEVEVAPYTYTITCTAHVWGEWEVTTPATCTEDGVKTRVCSFCGETETAAIPALGHTWGEWEVTTPATCTEAGVKTRTCSVCGETETAAIPAAGHNWGDDNICDDCGAKKSAADIRPVGPSVGDEDDGIVLPFVDVNVNDWFYNDVVYVYVNGLMNGTSATTFAPYGITTRGQIVTILWRLEGQPAVSGACPFTDVAVGSYYETAITWAAANGIVTGYDATTFGPDDQITREQMAAILYRYAMGKQLASPALVNNLAVFTDADKISAYAVEAMNWAVGQGLINGMGDGTVAPQGQAIRAQAAAILHRFCETLELL